jgi:hypothetical protein
VTLGARRSPARPADSPERPSPVVVAAAGSLAHIYLADRPGRLLDAEIAELYPALVEGLAKHPNVGAVMVRSAAGPVALSAEGSRVRTAAGARGGWGLDPLAAYGHRAAADLLQLDARDHVGDIVVLGAFDPATGEVTAFEELVGSHGGLGGGQTSAFVIFPADWPVDEPSRPERLSGLEVHELLLSRLRQLGLRPGDRL